MKRALIGLVVLSSFTSCASRRAAVSSPGSMFDAQVRNAVHMGDGDLEIQALRKRLLDQPQDVTLRLRLADRFEKAGYPDLALEHIRLAADTAPQDTDLQLSLAAALVRVNLLHQAGVVLAALQMHLKTALQFSRAAILMDQTRQLAQGEVLHRKALELDAASADLGNNLAYNLMQQNRGREAATILHELLRQRPTHERARNNLARLYATQLNQPEEALLHWKSVHGPAAAHNNLAAAYMEQGKWADARAQLEKALALRFQFPEAIQNLQIVAAQTGGTVTLNLDRDRKPSGLSKFAKAFRSVFVGEETESELSKSRRSRS